MDIEEKKKDKISWVLLVVLFAMGLWPVALLLLFIKLFGKDGKKPAVQAPPLTEQTVGTMNVSQEKKQTKTQKAVQRAMKSPTIKKTTAKRLKIIGCILLVLGFFACMEPLDMILSGYAWYSELLNALAIAVAGGALLGSGISIGHSLQRYTRYLAVMGTQEAISLEELSNVLGYPQKKVEKDLEKMLEKNYFGEKAYLNKELGYLFRSNQADDAMHRQMAQEKAERAEANPPQEGESKYSCILREIRQANDDIEDPVLSAKIDRLEDIAGRIFKIVEAEPQKIQRISSFFNYYLPTTQKLLDSYAQFENAGVEGENLRQAKARIESTLDAIVHGFEYQLDELYKADALDIDQDIRVMENMLQRDTATVEDDFGFTGDAAVQQQKNKEESQ